MESPGAGDGGSRRAVPAGLDVTQPNQTRVYDYLLGGKDNFEADRAAAEKVMQAAPIMARAVRLNREFHQRAARWIAGQGITQFVDIGAVCRRRKTRTRRSGKYSRGPGWRIWTMTRWW
jgi:S-adenosyl methyltransferase